MTERKCLTCGLVFDSNTSHRNSRKFCSIECYSKWCSSYRVGEKNPNWRGGKLIRTCLICGKKILAKPSEAKRGFRKFCSRECCGKWQSLYLHGENSPGWSKVKRICKTCGSEFYVPRCLPAKGLGKFCSHSCNSLWNVRHCKKKNTSIELKVEEILRALGIKYEAQKIIPEGHTVADFYIPEQRLVLYADGTYWHSKPSVKRRDATQDLLLGMHNYKVLRLKEAELKSQSKNCAKMIKKVMKGERCIKRI